MKAGLAVTEFLPADVHELLGGYLVRIEEGSPGAFLYFDSVDSELERNILRHVAALSPCAIMLDRSGGQVHNDNEIRIVVPSGSEREQVAVEFGVLRGLLDTMRGEQQVAGKPPIPWWKRFFSRGGKKT
jgi:hypothetical protein